MVLRKTWVPLMSMLVLCWPTAPLPAATNTGNAIAAASGGAPPLLLAKAKKPDKSKVKPAEAPPAPATQPGAESIPPLPERAPPEIRKASAKPREPFGPVMPTVWEPQQVKSAEEECARLLTAANFEYKLLPPIRQGMCGTPAPIGLKYVTDAARVELRPMATTNCRVGDALARWLRDVVQPRAWELLDARVIRVVTMSTYDCRQRNGDGGGQRALSQHAFANALDISEFVTAKGEHIRVLEHWDTKDERATFLREIHEGACRIFGTVLGPEANEAHRNHFHLDMTPRRHSSVCK